MKTKSKTRRKRQPSAAAQEKRQALCLKSKEAKMILKNLDALPIAHPLQECEKVNDVLRFWHRKAASQSNPDCWDTFKGWKERGFFVQKGESGFLIWGKPRKMKGTSEQETKAGTIEEIEKEYSAYPICYLFHAAQVKDENGNDFDPHCPIQKLILIPAKVKRMPLLLPAPKSENSQKKGSGNAA